MPIPRNWVEELATEWLAIKGYFTESNGSVLYKWLLCKYGANSYATVKLKVQKFRPSDTDPLMKLSTVAEPESYVFEKACRQKYRRFVNICTLKPLKFGDAESIFIFG